MKTIVTITDDDVVVSKDDGTNRRYTAVVAATAAVSSSPVAATAPPLVTSPSVSPAANSSMLAQAVLPMVRDGNVVPPAPAAAPAASSEIASTMIDAPLDRRGHSYNGRTMARLHGLQVDQGDLPYKYKSYNDLVASLIGYDGSVVAILHTTAPRLMYRPLKIAPAPAELPIDFYLEQPDGSMVRCDLYGTVDATLETRSPGVLGTVATGNPNPGGSTPVSTSDEPVVIAGVQKHLWTDGNGEWKEPYTPIGQGGFDVPIDMPDEVTEGGSADGQFDVELANDTPPQSVRFSIVINGNEVDLGTSNALHTGWNWGTVPKGAKTVLRGRFVEPLQRNAISFAAAIDVQVAAPGRGQAKYTFK